MSYLGCSLIIVFVADISYVLPPASTVGGRTAVAAASDVVAAIINVFTNTATYIDTYIHTDVAGMSLLLFCLCYCCCGWLNVAQNVNMRARRRKRQAVNRPNGSNNNKQFLNITASSQQPAVGSGTVAKVLWRGVLAFQIIQHSSKATDTHLCTPVKCGSSTIIKAKEYTLFSLRKYCIYLCDYQCLYILYF